MKVSIESMVGIDLDWVVSQVEGFTKGTYMREVFVKSDVLGNACLLQVPADHDRRYVRFNPGSNFDLGGRIVAREGICMWYDPARPAGKWKATVGNAVQYGDDFLITAMRCHCINKLGSLFVDLPPPFEYLHSEVTGHEPAD